MNWVLLLSIPIQFAAAAWSAVLLLRRREAGVGILASLMLLLAVARLFSLVQGGATAVDADLAGLPELLISFLSVAVVATFVSASQADARESTSSRLLGERPDRLRVVSLVVASALVLAILAGIGVLSYGGTARIVAQGELMQNAYLIRDSLNDTHSAILDIENAERGYILTGDKSFAETYFIGRANFDEHVRRLRSLAAEHSDMQPWITAIEETGQQVYMDAVRLQKLRETMPLELVAQEVSAGQGRKRMDRLHALIVEANADVDRLVRRHDATIRASARRSAWIVIAGSLITLALTTSSVIVGMVEYRHRRQAEAKLAALNGDLELRIQERTIQLHNSNQELQAEVLRHRDTMHRLKGIQRQQELILLSAGEGILGLDLEFRITFSNPTASRVLGFEHEPLTGRRINEILAHRYKEDVGDILMEVVADGIPRQWTDAQLLCKDGREFPAEGACTPVIEDGAVVGAVVTFRDVTERKSEETRTLQQLARVNLLSEITRSIAERQDLDSILRVMLGQIEQRLPIDFGCVFEYDAEGHSFVCKTTGPKSERLVDDVRQRIGATIGEQDLGACLAGNTLTVSDTRKLGTTLANRLCAMGIRSLVAAPMEAGDETFGVLVAGRREAESISSGEGQFLRQLAEHAALAVRQVRLFRQVKEALESLQHSQNLVMQQERFKVIGQMASGIAHDINNALSPATLYIESVLDSERSLSEKGRKYLDTVRQALDDITGTVARLRQFYRPQEMEHALIPVDLNAIVVQAVDLTRARWKDEAQIKGATIRLDLALDSNLPPILGIEGELRDALVNLIFNAVDAMPAGGTLRIQTALGESNKTPDSVPAVHLEVSDTGVGMDAETRRRCLEPFFTTKGERGSGLGLPMVVGTAGRHNAELEIDSTPRKGTVFRLRFPSSVEEHLPAYVTEPTERVSGLHVLVVDDDPLVRISLLHILAEEEHEVTVVDGGQAAIDKLRNPHERFDVVITDLGMPVVDGHMVASAAKQADPDTPVILLTGWGDEMSQGSTVPINIDKVLSKPPRLQDLSDALAVLTKERSA